MDHVINDLKTQLNILEEFFPYPEYDTAKEHLRKAIQELEKYV